MSNAKGVPTSPSANTTTSNEKNEPDMNAPLAEKRAKNTSKSLCLDIAIGWSRGRPISLLNMEGSEESGDPSNDHPNLSASG